MEKKLKIDIKPGWKEGTKITFHDEGVIFILKTKPHDIFQRDGANVIYTVKISLRDALCRNYDNNNKQKREIQIPISLDGKRKVSLNLEEGEIIKPHTVKILSGFGLPFPEDLGKRGDIIVKFDIKFPNTLTRNMKMNLVKLFNDNYLFSI